MGKVEDIRATDVDATVAVDVAENTNKKNDLTMVGWNVGYLSLPGGENG